VDDDQANKSPEHTEDEEDDDCSVGMLGLEDEQ